MPCFQSELLEVCIFNPEESLIAPFFTPAILDLECTAEFVVVITNYGHSMKVAQDSINSHWVGALISSRLVKRGAIEVKEGRRKEHSNGHRVTFTNLLLNRV